MQGTLEPFQVERVLRKVAYKLSLPTSTQIYNVFHVSLLRPLSGILPSQPHNPSWLHGTEVFMAPQPLAILAHRTVKRHNTAHTQYLVQWVGQTLMDAHLGVG